MNTLLKNRLLRISQLPAVLLALAINVGFASVGQAQEIPSMIITAERPSNCESLQTLESEALTRQIQTDALLAVWKTRVSVATELGVKLNDQQRPFRIARRKVNDKRG
jgi:hypothetical protein